MKEAYWVVGGATAVAAMSVAALTIARQPAEGAILEAHEMEQVEHGGDLVAMALAAHKVKFVFTLIGGHISPILVGCKKRGIRVIDTRHEVTAVFAADAVSRLSEQVGVACVTAGPGLTNTITAMKNAQMAASPLVLLGGATVGLLKGRGSLQDIDQYALFAGQCKWQASVSRVCDIVPTLDRAFHEACSGVPGPVFVELPLDVLYPAARVRKEILGKLAGKTDLTSRATLFYMEHYLSRLHSGISHPRHSAPRAVDPMLPARYKVERVAHMLRLAERPVMILGSSAVSDVTQAAAVAEAARSIGMPVFLSGAARGLLGPNDPLHMRHKRTEALKSADFVILAGVPCDFRLGYGMSIGRDATVVSISKSSEQLYLNRAPTLGVMASPARFLVRLADQLRGERPQHAAWLSTLRARDKERDAEIQARASKPASCDMNPLRVCERIDAALGKESILVADGGDFIGTASYIVRPRGPLSWLDPGPFGTLGVGAGFALGAKLVRPDAEVWLLWGDGSAGYSIMEYDTFVRHNVPVIGVIGNDSCWTQIARDQVPIFKDDVACPLSKECHYEKIVESMGGLGVQVHTEVELDAALELAKQTQAAGTPVLLNVMIGATDFRDGSISI